MSLYNYSSTPSPIPQPQLMPNNTSTTMSNTCCENGRTIGTNPHTGQSVCSCQYTPSLLSYPRVPGLGDPVYPTSAYASQGYMPLGADPSAFYPPLNGHYDLKDAGESWRGINQSAPCYPYDTPMSTFPYTNAYGTVDLNSASRRKNATRENTTTLKAWLYEHKKNPYPTKGEKIMLAIITKMTLTQVSTWFANARRRLKKENKMTWSPRNRSGEDNDDDDDDGEKSKADSDDDDREKEESIKEECKSPVGTPSYAVTPPDPVHHASLFQEDPIKHVNDGLPCNVGPHNAASSSGLGGTTLGASPLGGLRNHRVVPSPLDSKRPDSLCSNSNDSGLSDVNCNFNDVNNLENGLRPKIWSLAHVATSKAGFMPPMGRAMPPNESVEMKPLSNQLWSDMGATNSRNAYSGMSSCSLNNGGMMRSDSSAFTPNINPLTSPNVNPLANNINPYTQLYCPPRVSLD
ncbi:hypothetical protein SNE40_008023 [Patella caerulea]|uniref:Homeobox domain-containing protein n=2 Tax=Patella caerulea TaxID=87958 RepID=A0AAN8K4S0_PATCE